MSAPRRNRPPPCALARQHPPTQTACTVCQKTGIAAATRLGARRGLDAENLTVARRRASVRPAATDAAWPRESRMLPANVPSTAARRPTATFYP
jgi:hypothetical protein